MHYVAAAGAGYLTSAYIGWRGLAYRGVPNKISVLLYTPYASRQERTTRSLLELERLVSGLIRRGELAQIRN